MTFYAVLLMVVLLAWFVFKPEWAPAPPEYELKGKLGTFKESSVGWFKKLKNLFIGQTALGVALKAWAFNQDLDLIGGLTTAQREELAAFRQWLQDLSDAEADSVGRELSAFCQRRQVDIRWLLADDGRGDMQSVLSVMVLYYGLAVRERTNSRPAVAIRAWQEAPGTRQNRDFAERLFIRLMNAGMVNIPPELLFASEKQRRNQMADELKSLIAKDRDALLVHAAQVLEEVSEKKSPKRQRRSEAVAEGSAA